MVNISRVRAKFVKIVVFVAKINLNFGLLRSKVVDICKNLILKFKTLFFKVKMNKNVVFKVLTCQNFGFEPKNWFLKFKTLV